MYINLEIVKFVIRRITTWSAIILLLLWSVRSIKDLKENGGEYLLTMVWVATFALCLLYAGLGLIFWAFGLA